MIMPRVRNPISIILILVYSSSNLFASTIENTPINQKIKIVGREEGLAFFNLNVTTFYFTEKECGTDCRRIMLTSNEHNTTGTISFTLQDRHYCHASEGKITIPFTNNGKYITTPLKTYKVRLMSQWCPSIWQDVIVTGDPENGFKIKIYRATE